MRTTIVLGLIILFHSCASFRKPPEPVQKTPVVLKEERVRRVTNPVKKKEKKSKEVKALSRAVWHLIYPADVEFVLRHDETNKNEYVKVETTLSDLELPVGHYTIEAVMVGEEKFEALEGQEMFSFEIKKKAPTYIGSYVVECPKVGTLHFAELRKMAFFNRLNFTGPTGACEMIVGNDLANVRRAWSRIERRPGSKLQIGF